ncbi:MAG: electron transfer flavoprotein subunit beta/FixA family protein [Bacillota bacterium]
MKIIVLMKQTFDTEAKIQLDGAGKISTDGIQYIINPYDEFAVEEAIRIKEKLGTGEVILVSLGGSKAEEALRQALAMGADRAVLLRDPMFDGGDEHSSAVALAAALRQIGFDLVLGGQIAIDDGSAQVATRVAEILGLPQVNVVTKIELNEKQVVAYREADGTVEVVESALPALITAQKGLNEPRYPSLKGIMQAKKKELKVLGVLDLGLKAEDVGALGAKTKVLEYFMPPARKAGRLLQGEPSETAAELVALLREEAKVI